MPFPAFSEFQAKDLVPLGGLNDSDSYGSLQDDEASDLLNCHFDGGAIEKRLGRVQLGNIISGDAIAFWRYHFVRRDSTDDLIGVNGSRLYKLDDGAADWTTWTWKGAISGANPGTAADLFGNGAELGVAVQWNDKVFYADGGSRRKFYDITGIWDWGWLGGALPTPAAPTGPVAGGSLTDTQKYRFTYTYYNPTTGHETDPADASAYSASAAATPNLKFNGIVPVNASWLPGYSVVRIYRNGYEVEMSDTGLFFEREYTGITNLDTTPLSIELSISDASLGKEVEKDNAAPPALRYPVLYRERVFAVDAASPSTIIWSKPSNPYSWPPVNAANVEKDAGDPITALFVLMGRLYAVKKASGVFMISPNSEGAVDVQKISREGGCQDFWSVVIIGNLAYWQGADGYYKFDGTNLSNISSPKIRKTFKRFSRSDQFELTYGVYDRAPEKRYARWLVHDPDTSNNTYHLIYDVSRNAWLLHYVAHREWGQRDRVATLFREISSGRFWVITADDQGKTFRLSTDPTGAEVYSDAGFHYNFWWRSKWFGDGINKTLFRYLEFELEASPTGKKAGFLEVQLYHEGKTNPEASQDFSLFDGPFTTDRKTKALRFNVRGKLRQRFRLGFMHQTKDGHVKILGLRLVSKPIPSHVKGK